MSIDSCRIGKRWGDSQHIFSLPCRANLLPGYLYLFEHNKYHGCHNLGRNRGNQGSKNMLIQSHFSNFPERPYRFRQFSRIRIRLARRTKQIQDMTFGSADEPGKKSSRLYSLTKSTMWNNDLRFVDLHRTRFDIISSLGNSTDCRQPLVLKYIGRPAYLEGDFSNRKS